MSVSLKDRYKSPPGGFKYRQAETGWAQTWWDFEQGVRDIHNHRLANPRFNLSTNLDSIRSELDNVNALRCLSIRGGDIYVIQGSSDPPKSSPPRGVFQAAVGAVASGLGTIGAWLGKGGVPVAQELANSRASTCAKCPKNGKGDWTRFFTIIAATTIRKELERRNKLKFKTDYDEQLGTCEACLCPLKLKVHTPLIDIVEHMPDEVRKDLDPSCWILHE